MPNVGLRLKRLREERDLSQIDVAKAVGINNSVLSRIENDLRPVEDDLLLKFADFYGVTADYLLGRTNIPNHKNLPQTVATHLPEGFEELTPEAQKEVLSFIEFVRSKYGKKQGGKP